MPSIEDVLFASKNIALSGSVASDAGWNISDFFMRPYPTEYDMKLSKLDKSAGLRKSHMRSDREPTISKFKKFEISIENAEQTKRLQSSISKVEIMSSDSSSEDFLESLA